VSKLSEKYWAQGKDTELGVVQNRKYTSSHKLELNVFGSVISTSPFLDVHAIGGSVGYNFNQYVSLHAVAWKSSVSNSEAYNTFKQQAPTANVYTNNPSGFYGLQTNYNFLYGKASLFGDVIIYVDVFLLGGLGFTTTDSGSDFTPFVGIGQKVHLNKWLALSLDYRVMRFNESLYNRTTPSATYVGSRTNTTDAITLGFSFFL
jgi:outer membrane beta-barrel protein